jgi:hypothetical protein
VCVCVCVCVCVSVTSAFIVLVRVCCVCVCVCVCKNTEEQAGRPAGGGCERLFAVCRCCLYPSVIRRVWCACAACEAVTTDRDSDFVLGWPIGRLA